MSFSVPFPSPGAMGVYSKGSTQPSTGFNAPSHDTLNMKIDIPKGKEEKSAQSHAGSVHKFPTTATASPHLTSHLQKLEAQHHHQPHSQHISHTGGAQPLLSPHQIAPHPDTASVPSRNSSLHGSLVPNGNWQHHPRQPNNNADSYFPHSSSAIGGQFAPTQPPKTPGSVKGHSRQTSAAGGGPHSALVPSRSAKPSSARMSLSLSTGGAGGNASQADFANFAGPEHAGPPSPSTLTDIILGLHSTLYGGKRTPEEVRERVDAFYDNDAVFESPLLCAKGREQIANQFIMAFALPGMDVTSELRDVICSDFEFDGTRAGIIDQTISVTFLPALFGDQSYPSSHGRSHQASRAPVDPSGNHPGTSTPGYTLQSAGVTPHPFANYSQAQTPAGGIGSMFSRFTASRPHSPTTPYSISSLWASSRPHTPGAHSSHIRPLSTSQGYRASTPPSVNGEDEESRYGDSTIHGDAADASSHFVSANEAGGGQVARPQMPSDALVPHWSAEGLGRASIRNFLWGVFHPRAVLKSVCTIHLRLMSRLEFNDAGHIVRHEDSWGIRETIEGTIPFASVVYALERRVVGYLCSFAIGRGFRLSSALTRSIGLADAENHGQQRSWPLIGDDKHNMEAGNAARALLLGHSHRQEQLHSMARSRASSPSRHRLYSTQGTPLHGHHTFSAGTRSRARSLVGPNAQGQPARAASSDNLYAMTPNMAGYGDRERGATTGGGESLPPDSSARYRERGIRRPTSSTASAPVGTGNSLEGLWQQGDGAAAYYEGSDGKSRAPDRDL